MIATKNVRHEAAVLSYSASRLFANAVIVREGYGRTRIDLKCRERLHIRSPLVLFAEWWHASATRVGSKSKSVRVEIWS